MGKGLKSLVGKTCRYLSNVKSAMYHQLLWFELRKSFFPLVKITAKVSGGERTRTKRKDFVPSAPLCC